MADLVQPNGRDPNGNSWKAVPADPGIHVRPKGTDPRNQPWRLVTTARSFTTFVDELGGQPDRATYELWVRGCKTVDGFCKTQVPLDFRSLSLLERLFGADPDPVFGSPYW